VSIQNTTPANQGGVILDQICDNRYGTVYRNSNLTTTQLAVCDTNPLHGIIGTINANSFACTNTTTTTTGELDIANNQTAVCSFTVQHGENLTVIDTATVYTQSDTAANTPATPQSNLTPVTVISGENPSTATTSATVETAPVAACVTGRFDVTVANTSPTDENVTLKTVGTALGAGYTAALYDNKTFHDITITHGNAGVTGTVTDTNCAPVPSSTTTFSHLLGYATNSTLTNGGTYTCHFDGVVCGQPAAITGTSCAYGLTTQVQITPNLVDDDGEGATVSVTANTLTANICLAVTGS
jgi:hypothetical protein